MRGALQVVLKQGGPVPHFPAVAQNSKWATHSADKTPLTLAKITTITNQKTGNKKKAIFHIQQSAEKLNNLHARQALTLKQKIQTLNLTILHLSIWNINTTTTSNNYNNLTGSLSKEYKAALLVGGTTAFSVKLPPICEFYASATCTTGYWRLRLTVSFLKQSIFRAP